MSEKKLYKWQAECLDIWKNSGTEGIVNVITGAGKTILALSAADHLLHKYPNVRIRIVVPTISLAHQWKQAIRDFFPNISYGSHKVGLYYGTHKDDKNTPFLIYVINTARDSLSSHVINDMKEGRHVFMICDECHRYTGDVNRNIFRFRHDPAFQRDQYHCIGLSATPYCSHFEDILVPNLGREIYHYGPSEAWNDQVINPYVILHTGICLNEKELDEYNEFTDLIAKTYGRMIAEDPAVEYMNSNEFFRYLSEAEEGSAACQLNNLIRLRRALIYNASERENCLKALLRRIDLSKKIIIYCERIEQTVRIANIIKKMFTPKISIYHSELKKEIREKYLHQFRTGEHHILVACRALDEGIDVPDAEVGIVLSCSAVTRQRLQRLGRIIRKADRKDTSVLYYVYAVNTIDSPFFLDENSAETRTIDLQYYSANNMFYCEQYAGYAAKLAKSLERSYTAPQIREFRTCINEGTHTIDWLLDSNDYDFKITSAPNRHRKNYWICMKKIHQISLEEQTDMDLF